jgi:hypothetical protein
VVARLRATAEASLLRPGPIKKAVTMSLKDHGTGESVYEVVCERCGVTERPTLKNELPECGCGSPLWPLTSECNSGPERR